MDVDPNQIAVVLQSQFDVWLKQQIFENEFLIGGVATVLLGGLAYLVKSLPGQCFRALKRLFSSELTINNDTDSFIHVMGFIQARRINWLQRTFLLGATAFASSHGGGKSWALGPGYGLSCFLFEGRPVLANLIKEESDAGFVKQHLELRFLGRSAGRVRRFIDEVKVERSRKDRNYIAIMAPSAGGYWEHVVPRKRKRPLGTVFINREAKQEVQRRLEWFYDNEDWYRARGLPYKTGLMLHGPAGTGKSSLILALASHFDKDIRYLNLNAISEYSANKVLGYLSSSDMLVIEDIDTFDVTAQRRVQVVEPGAPHPPTVPGEDNSDTTGISLSTLLNILDGLPSPDGVVTIATTNHLSKLDSAITRKGRFDLTLELGPLDQDCFVAMFSTFYGVEHDAKAAAMVAAKRYVPITGAVAQDLFLHNGPDEALTAIAALIKAAA